jgi:D-threo-aldose 1-dehydrogenase
MLISLPALGMGTSRLIHHSTKSDALENLSLAFDLGIAYFDTAPIYGYGWSERLLGTFAEGKRDHVQIATKIGLQPSKLLSVLPYSLLVSMRKVAKTFKGPGSKGLPAGVNKQDTIAFDPVWALKSLEESLKRLKTDYVDVLLLHESTIDEANAPQTREFMSNVISAGKVRNVGIGSGLERLARAAQLDPMYTIVQHEYNISTDRFPVPADRVINTYGLFENMKRIKAIAGDQLVSSEIMAKCQVDLSIENDILRFCLAGAKYEYPGGVTLFSSTNKQHIKDTIDAWNSIGISQQSFQQTIPLIRK